MSLFLNDKELSLVLGLNTASCKSGPALTSVITPLLMQISEMSIFYLYLEGLFCLLMIYIDRKYRKFLTFLILLLMNTL